MKHLILIFTLFVVVAGCKKNQSKENLVDMENNEMNATVNLQVENIYQFKVTDLLCITQKNIE